MNLLAAALAVAVGAFWAVSPVGAAAILALTAVCAGATVGLPDAERLRVRQILAAGIALRLGLLAVVFIITPADRQSYAIFPDSQYLIDRSIWLRNLWMNVPLGPHQYYEIFFPFGSAPFAAFLAALQVASGPAPFGLSVLSTAAFIVGALAAYLVVRRGFGATAAQIGLVAILFWPSLVAWSVSVLKEPAQLFLTSIVCAGAASLAWSRPTARVMWAGAVAVALALLTTLRAGGMEVAVAGLALAVVLRLVAWRRWVVIALLAFAITGAWGLRERIGAAVRTSASRHIGHVQSAGVSYRLLDDRYYSDDRVSVSSMPWTDGLRFLVGSAIAFVLVPLPWQTGSRGTLALLPQQFAWYVMCLAAAAGFVLGMQRAPWLTCVLAGSALAGLLIIAPNSGNVGTLMRHRDLIVPFVLWLGGLGVVGIAEAMRGRVEPAREVPRP